jgi:hypothetical protein
LLLLLATPAFAQISDEEVSERLRFLDARLKANARLSTAWQVGWSGVYGVGMVVQAGRANAAESDAERADLIVSASKAGIGTLSRLLRPPLAMSASQKLRVLPEATPEERLRKLARAEDLLERTARESDARYSWIAHTTNIGLNVAGGLIVWLGYHDFARAAESAGIGVAVGELSIWTQPWQPKRDWKAYRRRYQRLEVGIRPTLTTTSGGGSLRVKF